MQPGAAHALEDAAATRGVSLAALSRMIGRNDAYLQQFVRRGTPRLLAERDRRLLAQFLGLSEVALGAAADENDDVAIPYLALAASAGHGRAVAGEEALRAETFSARTLRAAGIAPASAAIIHAAGDSMAPYILDADRLLVDSSDRHVPPAGGIFVARRADDLLVKRVTRRGDRLTLASDNPAYPPIVATLADVTIVGRVKLLLRAT